MSANPDRATKRWVAQQFFCSDRDVDELADQGKIPIAHIYEGVKGNGEPFTEYRYSKAQIAEFKLEQARVAARESMGGAA